MENNKERLKYDLLVNDIAAMCCNILNGDYCSDCWKFYFPFRFFCGKCIAFQDVISDLHRFLDESSSENLIDKILMHNTDMIDTLIQLKEDIANDGFKYKMIQKINEVLNGKENS